MSLLNKYESAEETAALEAFDYFQELLDIQSNMPIHITSDEIISQEGLGDAISSVFSKVKKWVSDVKQNSEDNDNIRKPFTGNVYEKIDNYNKILEEIQTKLNKTQNKEVAKIDISSLAPTFLLIKENKWNTDFKHMVNKEHELMDYFFTKFIPDLLSRVKKGDDIIKKAKIDGNKEDFLHSINGLDKLSPVLSGFDKKFNKQERRFANSAVGINVNNRSNPMILLGNSFNVKGSKETSTIEISFKEIQEILKLTLTLLSKAKDYYSKGDKVFYEEIMELNNSKYVSDYYDAAKIFNIRYEDSESSPIRNYAALFVGTKSVTVLATYNLIPLTLSYVASLVSIMKRYLTVNG